MMAGNLDAEHRGTVDRVLLFGLFSTVRVVFGRR